MSKLEPGKRVCVRFGGPPFGKSTECAKLRCGFGVGHL